MFTDPIAVFVVLISVLALLFFLNEHPSTKFIFKYIPLIVFAYFVPTLLSNTGVIPIESPTYAFIKKWLLPCSLVLLTLSVDLPAIMKLGRNSIILFFTGTLSIMIGGPLAFFLLGRWLPADFIDQAWRGLGALCGSWIGGGANFVAVGESVGASSSTISIMVIVDVAVANVWMAILLMFAGREKEMDQKIGADRSTIEELKAKIEKFYKEVSKNASVSDLFKILGIAFFSTWISIELAKKLPAIGNIISGFTWIVVLVTTIGIGLSFTRVRNLEGAGASKIGSVFLYILIASIGAGGEFHKVLDVPLLVGIGAVWMMIHAITMLFMRKKLKAPIFFLAVGSQANVGGASSAPVVASAFHPALAPVGVLLAVLGYAVGTYGGLISAFIMQKISLMF